MALTVRTPPAVWFGFGWLGIPGELSKRRGGSAGRCGRLSVRWVDGAVDAGDPFWCAFAVSLLRSPKRTRALAGRFLMIIPMLAIAGNLAGKKYVPPSLGTFPVTTPLFTFLLIGVIVIVGALTFFPALSLGPILEHLLMTAGKTF